MLSDSNIIVTVMYNDIEAVIHNQMIMFLGLNVPRDGGLLLRG